MHLVRESRMQVRGGAVSGAVSSEHAEIAQVQLFYEEMISFAEM